MENSENVQKKTLFSQLLRKVECFLGYHDYNLVTPTEEEKASMKSIEDSVNTEVERLKTRVVNLDLSNSSNRIHLRNASVPIAIGDNGKIHGPSFDWQVYECSCCHHRYWGSDACF